MTHYVLQITLTSPLTSSAGEGRVGIVDRDVAFDELGLPILPGRRLKGLWREAYRDVADAWGACGQDLLSVDAIFGKTGQGPGEGAARMHIATAELQKVSGVREWLTYLQHPKIRKILADDVVEHFTTVRAQTAMDRETGAARENSLRLTRTLKSGLIFRAKVHFDEPPDNALKNALALGAAAWQYMGTSRTRGLGNVRCCLIACDPNGQETDITEQVLKCKLSDISLISSDKSGKIPRTVDTGPPGATHVSVVPAPVPRSILRYRLILKEPVVIPASEGDPNTVVTRSNIPGSQVWGSAAWHYLEQTGHTPQDEVFKRTFLDGRLRFLTAYREAGEVASCGPGRRMLPIPHSIRKYKKDDETLVDFAEQANQQEQAEQPTKRFDRERYASISENSLVTDVIKTERNYHHARAGDRRKGRALGAQEQDGGVFFKYEAIQSGQVFQGAVLGSEDNLKALQGWLKTGQVIRIGRSRSAEYGEAGFEWMDETPQNMAEMSSEWNGFRDSSHPEDHPPPHGNGNRLIVTTLSPLLAVNTHGHPVAHFPIDELAETLGVDPSALRLTSSYTRTELAGGYSGHLRLPRQQWLAIAAGSVFVFEIGTAQPSIAQANLLDLEHNGLGLRRGEGYGRVAVNRQGSLNLSGEREEKLDDPEHDNTPYPPDREIPEAVQELLQSIVRNRCTSEMQQYAREIADQVAKENKVPTNSLLGRLKLILRSDSPAKILEKLRDPAKKQLTRSEIDMTEFNTELPNYLTLFELFRTAWTKPDSLTKELIKGYVNGLLENCDEESREKTIEALAGGSPDMCNEFLDYLMTALQFQSRTSGRDNIE